MHIKGTFLRHEFWDMSHAPATALFRLGLCTMAEYTAVTFFERPVIVEK